MWRLRTGPGAFFSLLALALLALVLWKCTDTASPPSAGSTAPSAASPAPASRIRSAANETDRIILSLFDSTIDGKGLAFDQQVRDRYRNAYIGIYLLQGCNTDVTEYHHKLARAMASEWAKQGLASPAPQDISAMLRGIIEEARSSYSMVYADTPCDKRNLPAFIAYFSKLEG